MVPPRKMTYLEYTRIAALAGVSVITVKRAYEGARCTANTLAHVHQAAQALALPLPSTDREEVA